VERERVERERVERERVERERVERERAERERVDRQNVVERERVERERLMAQPGGVEPVWCVRLDCRHGGRCSGVPQPLPSGTIGRIEGAHRFFCPFSGPCFQH
jgi:hypothetical protein